MTKKDFIKRKELIFRKIEILILEIEELFETFDGCYLIQETHSFKGVIPPNDIDLLNDKLDLQHIQHLTEALKNVISKRQKKVLSSDLKKKEKETNE